MTTRLIVGTMISAFALGAGAASAEEKAFTGLTSEQFSKNCDKYGKGYWPKSVKGYEKDKQAHYDITWETHPKKNWDMLFGLTQQEFNDKSKEYKKENYTIKVESEYKVDGTTYYVAVWTPK